MDLAERGCPAVTVFDVRAPANVATALPRGTRVVVGDLEQDRALLLGAMRGVDVVFHCASPPYHLNDG